MMEPPITEGADDTTTSPEPISVDPPLAPTTDKDWFMSLASHSTDLGWDDTNHDGITETLTRPLAPITAVDTETPEDTLDDTEAREHPHSLNDVVDMPQDDGAPPVPSAAAITISLTTAELGPDYLHQESDSQCLAEGAPPANGQYPNGTGTERRKSGDHSPTPGCGEGPSQGQEEKEGEVGDRKRGWGCTPVLEKIE